MKSTAEKNIDYPCLMRDMNTDTVFLMYSYGVGTVLLNVKSSLEIAHHVFAYDMSQLCILTTKFVIETKSGDEFPKLMIFEDESPHIIYVDGDGCGVVVNGGGGDIPDGYYSENGWKLSVFKEFNGKVTLEN